MLLQSLMDFFVVGPQEIYCPWKFSCLRGVGLYTIARVWNIWILLSTISGWNFSQMSVIVSKSVVRRNRMERFYRKQTLSIQDLSYKVSSLVSRYLALQKFSLTLSKYDSCFPWIRSLSAFVFSTWVCFYLIIEKNGS